MFLGLLLLFFLQLERFELFVEELGLFQAALLLPNQLRRLEVKSLVLILLCI